MKMKNKIYTGIIVGLFTLGLFLGGKLLYTTKAYNESNNLNNHLLLEISNNNIKIDSLHTLYLNTIKENIKLDSLLDNSNKLREQLKLENKDLQSKLANLENQIENITSDSSYNYIMYRHKPLMNFYPYSFAPNQVKSLHLDILTLDEVLLINQNLNNQLVVADSSYNIITSKYNICDKQVNLLLNENSLLKSNANKYEEIIDINNKDIIKQKTLKTIFGVSFTGIVIYELIKITSDLIDND